MATATASIKPGTKVTYKVIKMPAAESVRKTIFSYTNQLAPDIRSVQKYLQQTSK